MKMRAGKSGIGNARLPRATARYRRSPLRELSRGRKEPKVASLFQDESGTTTMAMAISIFISIALIFTSAQVYRVNSAAAEIQEVADACALAAENEVAEFVTAVNICDATLLSMTLLAGTLYGIGLVAACVPLAAPISEKCIELATKTMDARERAHASMVQKLDELQRWLPFLASANALGVAQANNEGAFRADYLAIAELVPASGESVGDVSAESLAVVGKDIEEEAGEVREKAQEADEAAKRASEAKLRAFMADCGAEPGYCMSERARSLCGLNDSSNPLYSSVDAWSFDVGLKRIKAYYAKRLATWTLTGSNVEQKADSVLRKRFYQYALDELADAYVHEEEGSFEASIPSLYRNTAEMKRTRLYTEAVYPVTQSGELWYMHAWSGCPNARGAVRMGSVSEMDNGGFAICSECRFSVSSLGKVASASTSIANGFEHHYQTFREALEEYEAERSISDPLSQMVKDELSPLIDSLRSALSDVASRRLQAQPPGRDGCVALVVDLQANNADTGFENLFVANGQTLGTRVAVAGALIIGDETEAGESSISTILEKVFPQEGFLGSVAALAGNLWTGLLRSYEQGQTALMDAVEGGLSSFSTNTSSGLGAWARDMLSSMMETIGLQPSDVRSKKPILVNTARVVSYDGGRFAVTFRDVKQQGLASSTSSGLISGVASKVSEVVRNALSSTEVSICEVELPFLNGTYTIEWALPEHIANAAGGAIDRALSALIGTVESSFGIRVWQ